MIHPSEWRRMTKDERMIAVYSGKVDSGIHWKVVRIAQTFDLDPLELDHHVGVERGWEAHDPGYTKRIVESAVILKARKDGLDCTCDDSDYSVALSCPTHGG